MSFNYGHNEIRDECIQKGREFVLRDKHKSPVRSRIVVTVRVTKNRSTLTQYELDGCLKKESGKGKRCDYLVVHDLTRQEHFIELKTGTLEDAEYQIEQSVNEFSINSNWVA